MKKSLYLLFLVFCLMLPCGAWAEEGTWSPTFHFVVLMPADLASNLRDNPKAYDGVDFPLFCGIASAYTGENKFVYTKMTDLPTVWVDKIMAEIEMDGFVSFYVHKRPRLEIAVNNEDFSSSFKDFAFSRGIIAASVSWEEELPENAKPRFIHTCTFNSSKNPPTDCAYSRDDVFELYIPFSTEEIQQIGKDHARR